MFTVSHDEDGCLQAQIFLLNSQKELMNLFFSVEVFQNFICNPLLKFFDCEDKHSAKTLAKIYATKLLRAGKGIRSTYTTTEFR